MAIVDWEAIIQGNSPTRERKAQPNVKFFFAYNENYEKSLAAGRPVYDEIESISLQWPGQDETVRKVEPHDIREYSEKYRAFREGNEAITEGTALASWPPMNPNALRELQYLGFKTVEQLAAATDDVKKKLGPLSRFCKTAKDWVDASNSHQGEVVKLKALLEDAERKQAALAEKLELFMQRVEANEGTDLRGARKEVIASIEVEAPQEVTDYAEDEGEGITEEDVIAGLRKRGRPRKV